MSGDIMKTFTLLVILAFTSAGLLQARSMEGLRKSSEDIRINTSSLRKPAAATTAAGQYEIQPSSVNPIVGLAQLIANILKLIFGPNGDIEIANPSTEVPQVDGVLEDGQSPETYDETQTYDPIDPSELPEEPFQQQPQQPQQQPQAPQSQTGQPNPAAGGATVPADLKRKALEYFNANPDRIKNRRYIGIVDFAAHSSKDRFWILDLQNGTEHAIHVAHGTGSDPDNDGYATRFSNVPNSHASSLGFYVTGDLYNGQNGRSMRLHGLSSTNSNALSRAVVLHDSDYVREGNYRAGRSWGCLAVANSEIANVLAALRGSALIYAGLSNSEF
jgi:hypothetical protein